MYVKDNWGWCTGKCPDNTSDGIGDDSSGCYDARTGKSNPPTDAVNECNFEACPGTDDCDGSDPWVYYDGEIVVEP